MRANIKLWLATGLFVLFSFFVTITLQPRAYAVDVISPACKNADPNNLPQICKAQPPGDPLIGPDGVLTKVIGIISLIIGITAVIVIIIAGIRFMTSGGDPQQASGARQAIIYAAIGLVVAASAQLIVAFVLNKVG